jgi:hypothetical protein
VTSRDAASGWKFHPHLNRRWFHLSMLRAFQPGAEILAALRNARADFRPPSVPIVTYLSVW